MQKGREGTGKYPEIQEFIILKVATGGQFPPMERKGKQNFVKQNVLMTNWEMGEIMPQVLWVCELVNRLFQNQRVKRENKFQTGTIS